MIARRRFITHGQVAALLGLLMAIGCEEPQTGPKRAGYREATVAHYHPDVAPEATTRPAATRPADFQFGMSGVGSPVMMVNGEPVTVPEILEPMIEDLTAKAKGLSEISYREYLTRRIVEQTSLEISRVLIYQEARKTFPEKADEIFTKEADRLIQDVVNARFSGVMARYEAHLKALDLSLPEMKERAKRQLMISQFLGEKFRPLLQNPPRGELLKYYREHEAEFTTPARAELFLIEVPILAELKEPMDQATAQEIAEARGRAVAQIRRAREEIESGIPFADVARQYSRGLQAARGGVVGEISPGALTQHWARAAEVLFTLAEGELSQPIETEPSILLVKCGRKTPARKAGFEECQEQLVRDIKDREFDELQRKYLMALEAKATVHRRHEFMLAVFAASPRPPGYESASSRGLRPEG